MNTGQSKTESGWHVSYYTFLCENSAPKNLIRELNWQKQNDMPSAYRKITEVQVVVQNSMTTETWL